MNYSSGTATIERILRVRSGKITIGTKVIDTLGTSEIRQSIDDAERYIDAMLSDLISNLPVSGIPGALRFAADYFAAYLVHTEMFAANKPGEESAVALNWKHMADDAIKAYKANKKTDGGVLKYTAPAKAFTERGVAGVGWGELKGVESDDEQGIGQG